MFKNIFRKFICLVFILILFVLCILFLNTRYPSSVDVEVIGNSMKPTLNSGEKLTAHTDIKNIKRGDIIIFKSPDKSQDGKILIKRVIGLPGEKIKIQNEKVFINDGVLSEPYINEKMNSPADKNLPVDFVIPTDAYYVMGDNRNDSRDSRYFGVVSVKSIIGKVNKIK